MNKFIFLFYSIFFWLNICNSSEIYIRSLKNAKTKQLNQIITSDTIGILFQSDCISCKKQIRDLKCLEGKYSVVLLGAFSSEKKLKKEVNKYYQGHEAYYVDEEILKHLKVTEVLTPQILLFFDKNQSPELKLRGYRSCTKLLAEINQRKKL